MPIPLPNLDDRNFPDLFDEIQANIPRYAPDWTDHNVSDPGIMLVELFVWLTEALIYRLNRIPEASQVRLLELLAATFYPARPATVDLDVEAIGLDQELILPRGTPLRAIPDDGGATLPFETAHDLTLTPDEPGGAVQARQTALVQDERLGTSDGRPHQVFHLAQTFLAGDPAGQPLVSEVRVGNRQWSYKPSLLELTGAEFTTEPRLDLIRFGDGLLGRIPPAGEEILASYRYTRGLEGNVSSRTEFTIDYGSPFLPEPVAEAIASDVRFSFRILGDAYGGTGPTSPDEARDQVTRDLRTRWRVITQEGFEQAVLERPEFNLARAKCLPELDLSASDPFTPRPSHLSLIVVPGFLFRVGFLFNVALEYQGDLEAGELTLGFRGEFESHGITLSDDLTIDRQVENGKWWIKENDTGRMFIVSRGGVGLNVNSVGLEEYQGDLEAGELSLDFRGEFKSHGITLSDDLTIERQVEGSKWRIKENDTGRTFIVSRTDKTLYIYDAKPEPSLECRKEVERFLDTRRLITCRHHVVGPTYTDVRIRAEVVHIPRVSGEDLLRDIENNLRDFFDPLKGGPEGKKRGWPFGRAVYASEVYQVIENTEGVDYANSLTLWHPDDDGSWSKAGEQVPIALNSLVHFVLEPGDIQIRATP